MYKAREGVHMPFRQQTTELQAFGFDSRDCKRFWGSSEGHSKLFIRIRNKDLTYILNDTAYGTSQIYARTEQTEPLQVQPGYSVHIKTKSRDLVFQVSGIHVFASINRRPRFSRTAVLSGSFA